MLLLIGGLIGDWLAWFIIVLSLTDCVVLTFLGFWVCVDLGWDRWVLF